MSRHFLPGTAPGKPPLEITLRRSARARRFSLRVSQLDGSITLTLPTRAREAEALAFAREKAGWLQAAVARSPGVQRPAFGQPFPVEGRALILTPAALRSPRIEGEALMLPADPDRMGVRLETWLKHNARQRLQHATEHYAAQVGRRFGSITLRDTRSRWGSCTASGDLNYSWRLIMAPPAVLDYVAAHEVAHLVEMNHSPDFWAVVAQICPGYAPLRGWLRSHGNGLQAWRLRD